MVGIAAVNLEPFFPEIGKRPFSPLMAGTVQIFISVGYAVPGNLIFHVNAEQGQTDRKILQRIHTGSQFHGLGRLLFQIGQKTVPPAII